MDVFTYLSELGGLWTLSGDFEFIAWLTKLFWKGSFMTLLLLLGILGCVCNFIIFPILLISLP